MCASTSYEPALLFNLWPGPSIRFVKANPLKSSALASGRLDQIEVPIVRLEAVSPGVNRSPRWKIRDHFSRRSPNSHSLVSDVLGRVGRRRHTAPYPPETQIVGDGMPLNLGNERAAAFHSGQAKRVGDVIGNDFP
jgi:hypothetical protein